VSFTEQQWMDRSSRHQGVVATDDCCGNAFYQTV
jgi:hypothetical protein